ncbi:Na/Pi cotransporter family protein [Pseudothauera nasutitermitis]|nr:Na/Pi symporter [Pseudothauera nasutitermitis]
MKNRAQAPHEETPLEATEPSLYTVIAGTFGGIGLFLLGMHLLTDGLKLAAGRALEELLERFTSTRLRGLGAGILITALVQSSTAVTLACIGFVNTGLLSLRNGLWVIFGSNLGTTTNAWLVAWLGFGFKISAFALPFVGIGATLMLAAPGMRTRALGRALAGFGVLFLGIDVLKDTFSAFGEEMNVEDYLAGGLLGQLLLVLIGTLMTVLMQASGAVIAIVITAASGGLLSIEAACALVIGTNIGTTFTAILAAIGATSNARRLAASHVFFNLITGVVALLMLPVLIALLGLIRDWFGNAGDPATTIALFHTAFSVLGVLLMVPLSNWLLRTLEGHFKSREEEVARPQYLDANSAAIPDLALRALRMELNRSQAMATACLRGAAAEQAGEAAIRRQRDTLQTLSAAIAGYTGKLNTEHLPPVLVDHLARSLRVLQYQENAAESSLQAAAQAVSLTPLTPTLHGALTAFATAADALADAVDTSREEFGNEQVNQRLRETEEDYARLKEALLVAGAHAQMSIRDMQEHLRHASLLRRAAEQAAKAAHHLAALDEGAAAPQDAPAGVDQAEAGAL